MDIYEARRRNLLELIQNKFEGNRSLFSRSVGKNVNMINLCLTNNPDLRRNIGEKLSRELEAACSLPEGWMDEDRQYSSIGRITVTLPRLTPLRSTGELITEGLTVGDVWLRNLYPSRSIAGIAVHVMCDDTMTPTIERGDILLVDTEDDGVRTGVFVLQSNGEPSTRRMMLQVDGQWAIITDNPAYPSITIDGKKANGIKMLGKVIGKLHYTDLL